MIWCPPQSTLQHYSGEHKCAWVYNIVEYKREILLIIWRILVKTERRTSDLWSPWKNLSEDQRMHFRKPFLSYCHSTHWLDCEFQSSSRLLIDSLNSLECFPGFKILTSPPCRQGSVNQPLRPVHAPGVTLLRPRLRIFLSIMSRTSLSFANCLAKAALFEQFACNLR